LNNCNFTNQVHIILVSPQDPLNIGSVARAMKNLGFSQLRLVAPRDSSNINYLKTRSYITACHATDIVDRLVIFDTLESAISDLNDTVGFTNRKGRLRGSGIYLPEWCIEYCNSNYPRIGLIFGREDNGLSLDELALCRLEVEIPTFSDYNSFNLAQAVLLALYQLRLTGSELSPQELAHTDHNFATLEELKRLDILVEQVLWRCNFYKPSTPTPIPNLVKRIFRRMAPSKRELKVLLGIFGKINRILERKN
jgi:tRNA/rRNA methyltransferase